MHSLLEWAFFTPKLSINAVLLLRAFSGKLAVAHVVPIPARSIKGKHMEPTDSINR
jgi:hypothetical protein